MNADITPKTLPVGEITAMADGRIIDVARVKDPVFARQALGHTIAFQLSGEQITLCSPASGKLSVIFPSGEAFGVTMENGMELLVHIGVYTEAAEGNGFEHYHRRQGEYIHRGDEIVTVNFKRLSEYFDMTTMLVITDARGYLFSFLSGGTVKKGQSVLESLGHKSL